MKNQFVSYEIACKLEQLGFDEECLTEYTPNVFKPNEWNIRNIRGSILLKSTGQNDSFNSNFTGYKNSGVKHFGLKSISAPLKQQAIDWIRETFKIHIVVDVDINKRWYFSMYDLKKKRNFEIMGEWCILNFETYDIAFNKALENVFKFNFILTLPKQ